MDSIWLNKFSLLKAQKIGLTISLWKIMNHTKSNKFSKVFSCFCLKEIIIGLIQVSLHNWLSKFRMFLFYPSFLRSIMLYQIIYFYKNNYIKINNFLCSISRDLIYLIWTYKRKFIFDYNNVIWSIEMLFILIILIFFIF